MQKYQSHKIVEAGKIVALEGGPSGALVQMEGNFVAELDFETYQRFTNMIAAAMPDGEGNDLGYFVLYADGYQSWSPSKAFEEGYDLLQPSSGKSKIAGYRELTEAEIDMMNNVKLRGLDLGQLVEELRGMEELDQRWVSLGATHLQQGLMALTRAIARPDFF